MLDVLDQHVTAAAPRFSELGVTDVPLALEELVRCCMSKEPAARPASASTLRARLIALEALLPWSEVDARRAWQLSSHTPARVVHAQGDVQDVAFGETVMGPRPS